MCRVWRIQRQILQVLSIGQSGRSRWTVQNIREQWYYNSEHQVVVTSINFVKIRQCFYETPSVRSNLAIHLSDTPFAIRQPIQKPCLLERVYKPICTPHWWGGLLESVIYFRFGSLLRKDCCQFFN